MEKVIDCIKSRRSIRCFKPDMISKDIIEKIVVNYTSLTSDDIKSINEIRKDRFYTPEEMLEIKGVDFIV